MGRGPFTMRPKILNLEVLSSSWLVHTEETTSRKQEPITAKEKWPASNSSTLCAVSTVLSTYMCVISPSYRWENWGEQVMRNRSSGRTIPGGLDCPEHLLKRVTITAAELPEMPGGDWPHVGCPQFRRDTASGEWLGQEWPGQVGNGWYGWGGLSQRRT